MAKPINSTSDYLFERAAKVMPGGNSRHTIFFPPFPPYAASGRGCRVTDVEGVERIDFINNYSSLIHGHCHAKIVEAVTDQAHKLFAVGLPTESEIILAELLCARLSGIEHIRFANSGTEAVMFAIKAARAFTGRPKIAKIEGAFHGSYDPSEIGLASSPANWGPAVAPASVPLCHGTPRSLLDEVIILPQNDIESSIRIIEDYADTLAGVIIDPIPSRIGFLAASKEYIHALHDALRRIGALLIFDEVYSFRMGMGGMQEKLNVTPDLTALGKIIGGGLPVGAVGGRRDCMAVFSNNDDLPRLIHGGTYNANPMTMRAGLAAMELMTPDAYAHLDRLGERLRNGIVDILTRLSIKGVVRGQGSLTALRIGAKDSDSYRSFMTDGHDEAWARRFHGKLLARGILCTSSLLFILSTPMSENDIDICLNCIEESLLETRP